MSEPRCDFACRIRAGVEHAEIAFQIATGATWTEAYTRAWAIGDAVYDLVLSDDRPVAFLGLRMISNPNRKGM